MKPFRLAIPFLLLMAFPAVAAELPKVAKVDLQPLGAQALRIADALDLLGAPLSEADKKALAEAAKDKAKGVETIQSILDQRCLAGVEITKGSTATPVIRVKAGPAKPELAEQGWRVFLVKVHNAAEVSKLDLRADSPNAAPLTRRSTSSPDPMKVISLEDAAKRYLEVGMFNDNPLVRQLSGLEVEYRIVEVYCRDAGVKEAKLGFNLWSDDNKNAPVAKGEPIAFRFESAPAVQVKLKIKDHDGKSVLDGRPVMGAFKFEQQVTDKITRIYPAPTRRLAPDFNFHFQVYRADGETVALQPGKYTVTYTRGPEYLVLKKTIMVPKAATHTEAFELKRWVHPAVKGWYSGDHHIHAAGCSHYENPTEGVTPEDMMRHILGEDLNVGCCLSWGPCWYHQKNYFEGKVHKLSTPNHILRYDVEVSGFPSSHSGHICLLRLKQQDYPGTKLIQDWPSWDMPIFKWAKEQGGVVGFAHSGWGLDLGPTRELPNYTVPPMNGIGANEYIVDVTHGMCDFISTVDTPSVWELNIWYHTLNCGYRCRISGETDFPCIYGERVGLGRSYVHLDGKLDFDKWVEGIKDGRCYVSDGKSHLMDFSVNGTGVGLKNSEVKLKQAGQVEIKAKVAALLEPKPTPATERIRNAPLNAKPYWDIERCRIDSTRKVPVEVVVNGIAVDKKEIIADGTEQEVTFSVPIKHSSWVCLRILPSSHTNPVFVLVDDKPIRASKKSAEWCIKCVDACWKAKAPPPQGERYLGIRKEERPAAQEAYDKAREAYRKILKESIAD